MQNSINDEYEYIFVKSFRNKHTGQVITAASKGKKAFRIKVKKK